MLLTIGNVLDDAGLEHASIKCLTEVDWQDGTVTAGANGKQGKAKPTSHSDRRGSVEKLRRFLFDAVQHHPVMKIAARPNRWTHVMVSRTRDGGVVMGCIWTMPICGGGTRNGYGRICPTLCFCLIQTIMRAASW